jgi:asparagine N-glycosylation enzyme membrane subunit Stt3
MIQILIMIAVIVGLTVVPVMLAAKFIGAGKTGFGAALLAVFLQACLTRATQHFVSDQSLAMAIVVVASSAVFSFTLDTTILRGFVVSILTIVITLVVIALFSGSVTLLSSAT